MSACASTAVFVALLLSALTLPAAAVLPATTAGSLDPTFGTGGKVVFNVVPGSNNEDIGNGAVQPDGKLVSSGYIPRTADDGSILVVRFLDNGAPDPSFGSAGVIVHAIDDSAYADSFGPAIGADGRIFVVGGAKSGGVYRCVILALQPNGLLDATFGSGGVFRYPGATGTSCLNIAVQADGKIVALGSAGGITTNFIVRVTAAGVLDATFGNQGVATLPATTGNFVYGISIAASGAIYVSGGTGNSNDSGRVYRYTSAGILDASFAAGGVYSTVATNNLFLYDVQALPDGGAVAVGYHAGKHYVLRLTAAGVPMAAFGTNGVVDITVQTGYSAVSVEVQKDGKILVAIRSNGALGWRFAVARLTAAGVLDQTWGTGGIALLNLGTPSEVMYGLAQGPDGKVWTFGRTDLSNTDSAIMLARLLPDPITTNVVEFFNTTLGHYFITADPNEATAIDGGAAGPGWSRTNQTFKSGGPTKVCRFYGNPDINPATGTRRGPNSHFYTIETAECAAVKLDIGWRFESYDFNGWPTAGGACPDGTRAVKRAYNNRFAQNDSNHRYTTSDAIYNQMLGQGWTGEGAVFCAVL